MTFFDFRMYFPKWPFLTLGSKGWFIIRNRKSIVSNLNLSKSHWRKSKIRSNYESPFTSQNYFFWHQGLLPKMNFFDFRKYFPKQICREDFNLCFLYQLCFTLCLHWLTNVLCKIFQDKEGKVNKFPLPHSHNAVLGVWSDFLEKDWRRKSYQVWLIV